MGEDGSMIERLGDHGSVGRHDPARHEPKWRTRILVEAREVDGDLHRIGPRIDHCQSVRVFIADEHAIVGLDGGSGGRLGNGLCDRGHHRTGSRALYDVPSRDLHGLLLVSNQT